MLGISDPAFIKTYDEEMLSVEAAAKLGAVDIIVHPEDTRKVLAECMAVLRTKQQHPLKKHGNIPL